MDDPNYILYRTLMESACDAMIAAEDARKRGDVEKWKILVAKSLELKDLAEKVNPFKKPS